jgi:hypothetical protein
MASSAQEFINARRYLQCLIGSSQRASDMGWGFVSIIRAGAISRRDG